VCVQLSQIVFYVKTVGFYAAFIGDIGEILFYIFFSVCFENEINYNIKTRTLT